MNKLIIIGNLTRNPETRTLSSGSTVCNFTVAVNRRNNRDGQSDADFFRISAWNKLGDICQRFLIKGRKVCVVGNVSVSSYETNDGTTRFSLDVFAEDVEFLSSHGERNDADDSGVSNEYSEAVPEDDDLPF